MHNTDIFVLLSLVSACLRVSCAERHSVFWNSTNPLFLWDDYSVSVRINDYLDIICPHYEEGAVPSHTAERYILYMVELQDYLTCKPQSKEQLRWECDRPHAPHGPERFSEKFQRFTPFTLGKEFKEGDTYYYISKPIHHHGEQCLRLKVNVIGPTAAQQPRIGVVHTTKAKLPADDPAVSLPDVLKSVANHCNLPLASISFLLTLLPSLALLLLL